MPHRTRSDRSKTASPGCSLAEGDRLIAQHLPLARIIAGRCVNRRPTVLGPLADDLTSAAYEGLVQAARAFQPGRGVRFKSFADPRITGACVDYLRGLDHVARDARAKMKAAGIDPPSAPISIEACPALMRAIVDHSAVDPLAALIASERLPALRAAVSKLPRRWQLMLTLRYADDVTLIEIGRRFGVSEARVYQILRKASRKIRAELEPSAPETAA